MLRLLNTQLGQGNLAHFPTLQEQQLVDVSMSISFFGDLHMQFNDRFQDMQCQRKNFNKFASLFEVKLVSASEDLQMESIELQGTSELKLISSSFMKRISGMMVHIQVWFSIPRRCVACLEVLAFAKVSSQR